MKQTFADSLKSIRKDLTGKVISKVPEWAGVDNLVIPGTLCTEQCSSSITAAYKASLVRGMFPTGADVILDGTGGLGVDSWFISKCSRRHIYIEKDEVLASAAEKNFATTGAANIEVHCRNFAADIATEDLLRSLKPDLVYLDPARRGTGGNKLVLIEDCEPDILGLLPMIWRHCPTAMIKLSPMADISMLAARLGRCLAEVHIVGACGEVKELLLILKRDNAEDWKIVAATAGAQFSFRPCDEAGALAEFPGSAAEFSRGSILFDPDPVLLKAGAFKLISSRTGALKAGRFTHLYLSRAPLEPGRNYEILETMPFNKRSIADIASRFPGADVSSRNLPVRSDELKSRISGKGKAKAGCGIHVFAFTADCTETGSERIMVLARPL